MLSVKQGGIKNHFLSLWYDSTREWTPVSRALRVPGVGDSCDQLKIIWHQKIIFIQWLPGVNSFSLHHVFLNVPGSTRPIKNMKKKKKKKINCQTVVQTSVDNRGSCLTKSIGTRRISEVKQWWAFSVHRWVLQVQSQQQVKITSNTYNNLTLIPSHD